MSRKRRTVSLYANVTSDAITPDLSKQVTIEIRPDTRVEKALYKMLHAERRRNERLLETLTSMKDGLHERNVRRKLHQLSAKLVPQHNPAPKGKNECN
jgi:hypothetical protein